MSGSGPDQNFNEVVSLDGEPDCGIRVDNVPIWMPGAAGVVLDGQILLCGGAYTEKCFRYDKPANEWVEMTAVLPERRRHAASVLMDGEWLLISGNLPGLDGGLNTSLAFDPNVEFFFEKQLTFSRYAACALPLGETQSKVDHVLCYLRVLG